MKYNPKRFVKLNEILSVNTFYLILFDNAAYNLQMLT